MKREIGLATLYLGDCRDIFPTLAPVSAVVTDPPFGVRDDDWDDMEQREFARFSMGWMSSAKALSEEAIIFGIIDSAVHDLAKMLYSRVRPMAWNKPPGSELRSAERGRWFAYEVIFHCYDPQDSGGAVADALRIARKRANLTRSAVDVVVRGKKTGLCYRWEEGACLPTPEQVSALKKLLPLAQDFDLVLEREYEMRAEPASKFDVLTYRTVTEGRHPCEKPVPLMWDIMETTGAKWATVCDPFMGSGSTGVAAVQRGRRFVGIEKSPEYFDIACKRIEDAQRQGDMFIGEAA